MTTHLRTTNPDSIEMTLEMTMTLREWKALKDEQPINEPTWHLRKAIGDMVTKATKHFYPETPQ